jgi:hypothetical protein
VVFAYQTLSETHWNVPGIEPAFVSELFTDVTRHMPKKKAALECYASQINHAPSHRLKHQWRLLGSVAARMDATTLKRSRSCESSSIKTTGKRIEDWQANRRTAMSTQPSPATFTFVTGHEFGEATLRAILGLAE